MGAGSSMESIAASLDHIDRVNTRRRQLEAHVREAEEQVLHRIGRAYTAGALPLDDLAGLYVRYRAIADPGFTVRWDRNVPIRSVRLGIWMRANALPNGDDGSWFGQGRPSPDDCAPAAGTSVVYVLYDEKWSPLYVGSTGGFRQRMKAHALDKPFTFWRAWPCADRSDAYCREGQMLDDLMPPLNRRREGRRTA